MSRRTSRAEPPGVGNSLDRAEVPDIKMSSVIHSDPEILGGTPVFIGTRVPAQTLVDYLEGGHPLNEFLEDFPTVSREQAVAALEEAKSLLLAHANSSR